MDTPEVYSPEKARRLIQGAASFKQFPTGEYIAELADQLRYVEVYLRSSQDKMVDQKIETQRLRTDFEALDRRYRELLQVNEAQEAILRKIAAGEKNPKKLVQEFFDPTKSQNAAPTPANN